MSAETWCSTVRRDTTRRAAISALRRPSDRLEHLELARGEMRGILARGAVGPARHATRPALAQALGDDRRGRPRAEAVQLQQAASQSVVVFGIAEGERRLVRAAELGPEARRLLPVARERRGVGPDDLRCVIPESGAPPPAVELAEIGGRALAFGPLQDDGRELGDRLVPALQPRRLGARRGHVGEQPEPAVLLGHLGCAIEQLRPPRRALPQPGQRGHDGRHVGRNDRRPPFVDDDHRGLDRLVPARPLERRPRAVGVQVALVDLEIVLGAVREPAFDVAVDVGVVAMAARAPAQAIPGLAGLQVVAGREREVPRLFEARCTLGRALVVVSREVDLDARAQRNLVVSQLLGKGAGARRPLDLGLHIMRERGNLDIGPGQLAPRFEAFEHVHRLAARALGLGDAAGTPDHLRQRAERHGFAAAIPELAMAGQRALLRGHRVIHAIREIALVCMPFEEIGELGRAEARGEPQGALVLGSGFAVRALQRRPLPGGRRVLQHRARVAGRFGVIGELRRVRHRPFGRIAQRLEDAAVQQHAPVRSDRLLDGEPGELVAERHRAALASQHAGREAGVEVHDLVRHDLVEHPHLDVRRDDGHHLERALGSVPQPAHAAEHGVAHRRRHRRAAACQHLGHVERIAGRLDVQLLGVHPVRPRELLDGAARERRKTQVRHAWSGAELPDGETHRVGRVELVLAIRDHDERPDGLGPPRDQTDDVQRRLVGPVHVLDHHDRGPDGAHFLEQRQEDRMRLLALVHRGGERTLQGCRHVDQGPERPRRPERVAGPPQHARTRIPRLAESAHQGALADARLARDEHEPAAPDGDVVEALLQRFQERRALEETALGTRVFGNRTHGGHRATPDERNQARPAEAERAGAHRAHAMRPQRTELESSKPVLSRTRAPGGPCSRTGRPGWDTRSRRAS